MRHYRFGAFEPDALRLVSAPDLEPGVGEIVFAPRAASLNYRDLMVLDGRYNPRLSLPATPLSDAAGIVLAVGSRDPASQAPALEIGQRVMTQFVPDWEGGPFRSRFLKSTLGTPGPGVAADRVVLPSQAVVPMPRGYDFAEAATLPIAALTAWSALIGEGQIAAGQSVLTLGTGGVSVFALQLAVALGARVAITSSSDTKLARATELGASLAVNYRTEGWARRVMDWTAGDGVDVVVETGGAGTISESVRLARAGGTIAMLGALTGLRSEIDLAPVVMRRLRIAGIMVDSRDAAVRMVRFLEQSTLRPVIDRKFAFDQLPDALAYLASGAHFGKVVVEYD